MRVKMAASPIAVELVDCLLTHVGFMERLNLESTATHTHMQ